MENSGNSGLLAGRYKPIRRIGQGTYGSVFLARNVDKDRIVVMKRVFIGEEGSKEYGEALNEVSVLKKLRHPQIVAYRDNFVHDGTLCIVMNYCAGGDVHSQIKTAKSAGVFLLPDQVLDWTAQILEALRYLHDDKKILHRDMKSQNVFLVPIKAVAVDSWKGGTGDAPRVNGWERFGFQRSDAVLIVHRAEGGWMYGCVPDQFGEQGPYGYFPEASVKVLPGQNFRATVKLGDFGISRALDHTSELVSTVIGTPFYMSPELVNKSKYNCKSDVWAAGCLVHEMSMLQHAFDATNIGALIMKIERMDYKPVPSERGVWAAPLISKMLRRIPEERFMASELLAMLDPHLEANALSSMPGEQIPTGEARRNFLDWRSTPGDAGGTTEKKNFLNWRGGRVSRSAGGRTSQHASSDTARPNTTGGVSPRKWNTGNAEDYTSIAERRGFISGGGGVTLNGGEEDNDITTCGGAVGQGSQDSPEMQELSTPELELSMLAEARQGAGNSDPAAHYKYLAEESGTDARPNYLSVEVTENSPKEWKLPSEQEIQVETKSFGYLQCPVGACLPKEESCREDLSNLAEIMGDVGVSYDGEESVGDEVRAYQRLVRMYAVGEHSDDDASVLPLRSNSEEGQQQRLIVDVRAERNANVKSDPNRAELRTDFDLVKPNISAPKAGQECVEEVYEEDFDDEDVLLTEQPTASTCSTAGSSTAVASPNDPRGSHGRIFVTSAEAASPTDASDADLSSPIIKHVMSASNGNDRSSPVELNDRSLPVELNGTGDDRSSPVELDMVGPCGSESPIGEESQAMLRNDSLTSAAWNESLASAAWESLAEECAAFKSALKHSELEYDDAYSDDFEEEEEEEDDQDEEIFIPNPMASHDQSRPNVTSFNKRISKSTISSSIPSRICAPAVSISDSTCQPCEKDDGSMSSPNLLISNSVFLPISDDSTVGMMGTADLSLGIST